MVSGLISRFSIHVELILTGVIQGSSFIVLHVTIQIFPVPLIEETIFSLLSILGSPVKY